MSYRQTEMYTTSRFYHLLDETDCCGKSLKYVVNIRTLLYIYSLYIYITQTMSLQFVPIISNDKRMIRKNYCSWCSHIGRMV